MEFNNNMTGNITGAGQSFDFGQINSEEYGQNAGPSYNEFCMTDSQVKGIETFNLKALHHGSRFHSTLSKMNLYITN